MGIPNLLRFMKPFIEPVHIKKYAGQRVGIDAYSWLHKGAYSCSMELCMSPRSAGARRYISYFMHHVNLLRHHKVVPVVVFDGGSMPCKSATDEDRHKKRELSLVLGKEKLEQGNTAAAIDLFRILKTENVEFVVAPYEADAQLAYLATLDADQGGIAAVITEDSDLIAYGCTAIIFKMDRFGNGEEFRMEKTLKTVKDGLCFQDFDQNLFTGEINALTLPGPTAVDATMSLGSATTLRASINTSIAENPLRHAAETHRRRRGRCHTTPPPDPDRHQHQPNSVHQPLISQGGAFKKGTTLKASSPPTAVRAFTWETNGVMEDRQLLRPRSVRRSTPSMHRVNKTAGHPLTNGEPWSQQCPDRLDGLAGSNPCAHHRAHHNQVQGGDEASRREGEGPAAAAGHRWLCPALTGSGMCVLAGCDFLPSVPGIGTKRAYSLISKHKNIDLVLSTLKLDKRYSVPDDYIDSFWKTLAVFNHARVALAPSMARAIAEGRLNPVTMETFDELSRTISPIEFIDTSALNVASQYGSQEILTQESTITICSSEESRDDIAAFVVDDITSGEQKCNKGVLALGKFLPQKHSSPAVECKEVKPKNTPDNNPFKKRKLPTDQGKVPDQNELLIDLDEEEAVVLCSSLSRESVGPAESLDRNGVSTGLCWPLTQESVASIPNERSSKKQEAIRNITNKNKDERSGLLKFFMRL
ncbi:Exonuclease 1 [Triticum urartu]|uniref:Exonuclease 1 n=1 Tax=Triticum urartu TaxID=4572 RepID=M7YML5_TRIUA|nr:Exonuclease 1 [Triticum urartu]